MHLGSRLLRPPAGLYPVNALRQTALELVPSDSQALCLCIDVDLLPPAALARSLAPGSVLHKDVVALCTTNHAVVLPALELDADEDTGTFCSIRCGARAAALLGALDEDESSLALAEHMAHIRSFHKDKCVVGHAATNINSWLRKLTTERSKGLIESDVVDAEGGYEPYFIASVALLKTAGGWEKRFWGWHGDKAELVQRLRNYSQFAGFCVLRHPAAFVLDWLPHEPTASRLATQDNALYVAAMSGLTQRCKRVIEAAEECCVVCILAAHLLDVLMYTLACMPHVCVVRMHCMWAEGY
jgi:hypothetical protein